MMSDAAPRLPQQLPGSRNDYAPIAPMAIAAVVFAVLFVLILVAVGTLALLVGKTVDELWLLTFPVLTVVMAFIARRQIRASEGALTGLNLANLAWTIAVIGGAVLIAYILAIQYAVRREASSAFELFATPLSQSDPTNPLDPKLAEASYYTLSSGQQSLVGSPSNLTVMQSAHQDAIYRLRASDLGRLIARNKNDVSIKPGTLIRSERVGSGINTMMAGVVSSPEGTAAIAVPLIGESQEGQPRRWHVVPPPNGTFFAAGGRQLTPYGWAIELLDQSVRQTAQDVLSILQQPGTTEIVYEGFIKPGGDPEQSVKQLTQRTLTTLPRASLIGGLATITISPPGMAEALDRTFADADGNVRTGADLERFRTLFLTPGRLVLAGARFKENPDVLPMLTMTPNGVEAAMPIEIILTTAGEQPPVARGRMIFQLTGETGTAFAQEVAKLKAGSRETTQAPPTNLLQQLPGLTWQLIRFESDLKPLVLPQASGREGMPQLNPDMMQ